MSAAVLPTWTTDTPQPYRWELLLAVLSRFAATALFRVHAGAYWRAFREDDAIILVRITADDPVNTRQLFLTQMATTRATALHHPLPAALRVVGASADGSAFWQAMQDDPTVWVWAESLYGMPNFMSESLYEALLFTVIEQHISWASALKVQARFIEMFGEHIACEGMRYGVLPTPQTLAALTRADLLPLKLTMTRLDLLLEIAQAFVAGTFADAIDTPPQAMYSRLLTLKGVGHWTAAVTVARAYGIAPFVHDNDVALQAAVSRYLLHQPQRATRAETLAAFAPYGEHAGAIANLLMMRWVLEKYPPLA